MAEILKKIGYRTTQFGKNHIGDRNEHMPTVHVFFGNLYYLKSEEEPGDPDGASTTATGRAVSIASRRTP